MWKGPNKKKYRFFFVFVFLRGTNTPYFHPPKIPKQILKWDARVWCLIRFWFLRGWKYAVFPPLKNSKTIPKSETWFGVSDLIAIFGGVEIRRIFTPPKFQIKSENERTHCGFWIWFRVSGGRNTPYFHPPKTRNQINKYVLSICFSVLGVGTKLVFSHIYVTKLKKNTKKLN